MTASVLFFLDQGLHCAMPARFPWICQSHQNIYCTITMTTPLFFSTSWNHSPCNEANALLLQVLIVFNIVDSHMHCMWNCCGLSTAMYKSQNAIVAQVQVR